MMNTQSKMSLLCGSRRFFAGASSRSPSSAWKKSDFYGRRLAVESRSGVLPGGKLRAVVPVEVIRAKIAIAFQNLHPNMKEISTEQELLESLSSARDQLVIVGFFSTGCGGCQSLHPKICMFAEQNPDAVFLQVNYEECRSMCYSLRVHVLPFFRFYRGEHGHLCSFSCTTATIKKFEDALAKHNTANKDLSKKKVSAENSPQIMKPMTSISGELVLPEAAGLFSATSFEQPKPARAHAQKCVSI